jgi:bifunctional polynucleotide phosphatase/kinase
MPGPTKKTSVKAIKKKTESEQSDVVLRFQLSRRSKLAIFDFDHTIVKPKDGRTFPKDADDWIYVRESVPQIMKKYAKDYQIVIQTDQSQIWKIDMIRNVVADLSIEPVTAIIGFKIKKPETALFESVFPTFNKEKSFYVGDAAGRQGDWSDKDLIFSQLLGVKFKSPEEVFPLPEIQIPQKVVAKNTKEVVIMVGYPGSGKSTIAKSLAGYHVVNGDVHKTVKAMISDAEKHVGQSSIVFDSTAGTKAKRAEYVKFAQNHALPVRTIWVKTSIDESMERNKQRALKGETKIPVIAFYMYRKNFEEPDESEGFSLVQID